MFLLSDLLLDYWIELRALKLYCIRLKFPTRIISLRALEVVTVRVAFGVVDLPLVHVCWSTSYILTRCIYIRTFFIYMR